MNTNDMENRMATKSLQETEKALANYYQLLMAVAKSAGQFVYLFDCGTGEPVYLSEHAMTHEHEGLWAQFCGINDDLVRVEMQCPNCGRLFSVIKMSGLIVEGHSVTAYVCEDVPTVEVKRTSGQGNAIPDFLVIRDGQERITELMRQNELFTIVLIDVDDFLPSVDDLREEQDGFRLITFADTMRELLRAKDSLFRYEDDKFLAVLPNCSRFKALEVMNRVQKRLEDCEDNRALRFCLGVSEFRKEKPLSFEDMIDEAGRALYRSKANKRMRK